MTILSRDALIHSVILCTVDRPFGGRTRLQGTVERMGSAPDTMVVRFTTGEALAVFEIVCEVTVEEILRHLVDGLYLCKPKFGFFDPFDMSVKMSFWEAKECPEGCTFERHQPSKRQGVVRPMPEVSRLADYDLTAGGSSSSPRSPPYPPRSPPFSPVSPSGYVPRTPAGTPPQQRGKTMSTPPHAVTISAPGNTGKGKARASPNKRESDNTLEMGCQSKRLKAQLAGELFTSSEDDDDESL